MKRLKRWLCAMGRLTAESWIAIGSTIFIPLAIAIVGAWVSSAIQESQKRVKYVELAIGILRDSPSSESEHTRSWAIQVMAKYSEVPVSEEMKRELRTKKLSDNLSLSETLRTEVKQGEKETK